MDKDKQSITDVGKREEETLKYWQDNKIFEKTLEKPSPKGEFVFYDGPPFATGLPHYGHLLGSTAKDLIPRYKTMRGYHVRRRWGWDTHGLPVENIVEKKLGLKNKKEILELGIEKFNELCRAQVLEYVHDWKKYVERVGRWVDFDNSYKTMDATYTESVWWALKQLHNKGLLYEGRKVLMYCPHCETPLAKAEIAMDNSYKDVTEEAVTVKLRAKDFTLLAWTTTPWTLPANVGLAVGPEIEYSLVNDEYVVASALVEKVFGKGAKVSKTFYGKELEGIEYEPLYEMPAIKKTGKRSHYVMLADFVSTEEGTGIVHTAVIYGEDDYKLGLANDLPMVPLLNSNGTYNTDAPEFLQGQYIKKADKIVIEDLEKRGLLFAKAPNTHSYPHCYRCGTPLIYNALSSWFINAQKIKAQMLELNEQVNWVPEHLKHGRFQNIVENAPDWTISRNRFWASPLPVWKCVDCKKTEIVGGLEDIKNKIKGSGNRYFLMRHGKTKSNGSGTISDRLDMEDPVTSEGKEGVRKSADKLKKEKIDLIVYSPFQRTYETAKIVASEIGLDTSNLVVEPRLGELQTNMTGKDWKDYWPQFGHSRRERFTKEIPGAENLTSVHRRAFEVMFELEEKYNNKNILIVTHEGITRILQVSLGKDEAGMLDQFEIKNYHQFENAEVMEYPFWMFPHNSNYNLDLHRPYIDKVELTCDCGGSMTRIPEVIDCWVESGAMPFAEYHYPFENKEQFEKSTPGDYVAEYIAQTRTWFYYMHALATGLWNTPAFKNVVTTGTILAADGSKMSKSKGNYTDPLALIDKYGADAYRYYMMSSVVMAAEDLSFRDEDVKDVYQRIVNILWNVVEFYKMYTDPKAKPSELPKASPSGENVLDAWILARLSELHKEVTEGLDAYNTVKAGRPIREFVSDFSTWYIRRSRDRFKSEDNVDREAAISTTRFVLSELSKILAPFMPFLADQIYKEIGGELESVHLENWSEKIESLEEREHSNIINNMIMTRNVVSLALEERQKANIKVRQPLRMLKVKSENLKLEKEYLEIIKDEVNVKEVVLQESLDTPAWLDIVLTEDLIAEGQMRDLVRSIQEKRKELELKPEDKISVTLPESTQPILRLFEAEIKKAVSAVEIGTGVGEINIEKA